MSNSNLSNVIQLLTLVAVVIGAGLVVYELRQNREIAQSAIVTSQFAISAQLNSSVFGEELAKVLAKDCNEADLTTDEALILRQYFTSSVQNFRVIKLSNEYGGMNIPWETLAEGVFMKIFTYPSAQTWWAFRRNIYSADIQQIGDAVSQGAHRTCAEHMAPFLDRG
ncbi:MAG: hypothetical protein AAF529_13115 [Pseudomonadota bacterium]